MKFLCSSVFSVLVLGALAGPVKFDCPTKFEPICGFDGKYYKMFGNECKFNEANSIDNNRWTIEEEKFHCRLARFAYCPDNFEPICAFDGVNYKLFDNECKFLEYNANDNHRWTVDNQQMDCFARVEKCPETFEPVCGFDGETYKLFDNECKFNKENTIDNNKWKLDNIKMHCFDRSAKCPETFEPVCGFDGKTYKLFDNECKFNKENTIDNNKWKLDNIKMHCFDRSAKCPETFEPICAFDGQDYRVFDNECKFNEYNANNVNKWIIDENQMDCFARFDLYEMEEDECPDTECTLEYEPICAFDGNHYKLFTNKCFLKEQSCLDQIEWEIMNDFNLCH